MIWSLPPSPTHLSMAPGEKVWLSLSSRGRISATWTPPAFSPHESPRGNHRIWEITGCSLLTTAFYCFFPLSTLAYPWALRDPHFIYYSHSFLGHLISQQPCEVDGEGIRVLYLKNKALRVRLINEWNKPAVLLKPSDSWTCFLSGLIFLPGLTQT